MSHKFKAIIGRVFLVLLGGDGTGDVSLIVACSVIAENREKSSLNINKFIGVKSLSTYHTRNYYLEVYINDAHLQI